MSLGEGITKFVAEHLPPDPEVWCKKYPRSKIIHDALWGTFPLRPYEVALLDTPLLQRLRKADRRRLRDVSVGTSHSFRTYARRLIPGWSLMRSAQVSA